MNNTFKTSNGLILSKKSRVKLTTEEMDQLKEYTQNDPAAFINIKRNTNVRRDTILKVMERGSAEVAIALKLRGFLKLIKEVTTESATL